MAKRKKKPVPPDQTPRELKDANRGERLTKVMTAAGVGSRRACEAIIAEGRVTVNRLTVTQMPVWVDRSVDKIEIDGVGLRKPRGKGKLYIMVNKPRGVICTNSDPEGRRKIIDLVPHDDHLFCVGRLDGESTGMVLLTNDGELANQLTHPRYGVEKTYRVTVKGKMEPEHITKMQKGIWLSEKSGRSMKVKAEGVRLMDANRETSRLEVTLTEGKNREIRRIMVRLGHRVKRLKRIAIGNVVMKGVASGAWRELTRSEVNQLRKAAKANHS